jgi:L-ascorbate metabolism protein UlaG (beta-lactamase superfamily)
MSLDGVDVTWLGHATFLFEHNDKTILVDPWLEGNPNCPEKFHEIEPDAILITHGHGDHIGNVFDVAERTDCPIVGIFDLTTWLGSKGVDEDRLMGMNKGGTVALDGLGVNVTMTDAHHSSSFTEEDGTPVYLGEPAGFVLNFDGGPNIYVAGDTCLFGDMKLIGELWNPDYAILPIGDHFTMDPRQAAHAAEFTGVKGVIPCHFGTFPVLTGTPDQLKTELAELGSNVEVLALEPGQTA